MSKHLPYDRAQRVGDEICHVISSALIDELSDPRLEGITVTNVRMTPDLRTARVYFHLYDATDEKRRNAFKGMVSARGYLKKLIGKAIVLKYMPEIEFFYDDTIDISEKLDDIFKGLRRDVEDE